MLLRIFSCLLVSVVLPAQERPDPYSKEKEAALGAQLAKEVRRGTTAVDSPAVQFYVDRLGQKLAALFGAGVSYQFTVVSDSLSGRTHEPISLPGGYIFVSSSLLSAAQDEAEFAGMLAHSLAHIANRDNARLTTEHPVVNYGHIPLTFVGGWTGGNEQPIPLSFVKTQRAYELDADREAVRVLWGAGYDPSALVRYVGRLQASDALYSPLPPRAERLAALDEAIRQLPPSEFERMKNEVRGSEPHKPNRQIPTLLRPDERP